MATAQYTALANVTLGSTASSVTFSSISQSYRDLMLVYVVTAASGYGQSGIRFNSDTGTNYNDVWMRGTGSSAVSSKTTNATYIAPNQSDFSSTANNQIIIQIMDYSATDKHKSCIARSDNSENNVFGTASRWANTSAVTTVQVYEQAGANFAAGSTFALYGVK